MSRLLFSDLLLTIIMVVFTTSAFASEEEAIAGRIESDAEFTGSDGAAASNRIAAVNNTDLKWTYIQLNDANDSKQNDFGYKSLTKNGGWISSAWRLSLVF